MKFELKLGENRLSIDSRIFTPKSIELFSEKLEECRENRIKIYTEVVAKVEEITKEYAKELEKKENESDEEYVKRTEAIIADKNKRIKEIENIDTIDSPFPYALDITTIIAGLAKQEEKINKEIFYDTPWEDTQEFLYKVLKFCKQPLADNYKPEE